MEHVVEAGVLPGALHGHHVLGVGHHADHRGVPLGILADGAQPLPLGEVLAHGAAVDGGFGADDGVGKGGGLLLRQGEDEEGQPLGGLAADAVNIGKGNLNPLVTG